MTSAEFLAGLSGEKLAYAQNLVGQRDDSLSRITAHEDCTAKIAADHKAKLDNKQADCDKLIADRDAANAQLLENLHKTHLDEKAVLREQIDTLTKERDDARTLCDALGGTELGQKMKKDKERADLLKAKTDAEERAAALAKQLDEIDSAPVKV